MGGNIFKGNRRYLANEYRDLESEVIHMLSLNICIPGLFEKAKVLQPLKYYKNKESFGDLDIVFNSYYLCDDYIQKIIKVFKLGHGEWNKNSNVFSFLYKNFQIDLIIVPIKEYKTSLDYYAYNDLGNLVGRISHKMGIKYGHHGASIIIRDGDYKIGEILISTDTKKIHELLNLNHDEWLDGFDSLEDMYTWVSDSKYFNKDIYNLDNRNHYARTRDKKRAVYSEFLRWCSNKEFINNYHYEEITSKNGYNIREPFFTELICKNFIDVKPKYNELINAHSDNIKIKQKFNGEIIRDITGLTGKELGEFIRLCKAKMKVYNIDILINNKQFIELFVLTMFEEYKNK